MMAVTSTKYNYKGAVKYLVRTGDLPAKYDCGTSQQAYRVKAGLARAVKALGLNWKVSVSGESVFVAEAPESAGDGLAPVTYPEHQRICECLLDDVGSGVMSIEEARNVALQSGVSEHTIMEYLK